MKQHRVVITGASGYLGFHIARECLGRGWETIVGIRTRKANVRELEKSGARVAMCDLMDPATYQEECSAGWTACFMPPPRTPQAWRIGSGC